MTRKIIACILCGLVIFGLIWAFLILPSEKFKTNTYFSIEQGESLSEIGESLARDNFVRSPFIFKSIVSFVFFSGNEAVAGDYFFEKPLNAFSIARRVIDGKFILNPVKVTIPEGLNVFETASVIKKNIPLFDSKTFIESADEGYIFPDTYFFAANITPNDVIKFTKKNFDRKIEPLSADINRFGKSLEDVIKMASILETEATSTETRKIIAGILWKRIALNIPLQVDVSFKYINGKNTFELTNEDLALDSPYNSYKYGGLPPTPISNPSLDAIKAAINPAGTKYLYFVSDKRGIMHYAVTFEEHKKNKAKYLKGN